VEIGRVCLVNYGPDEGKLCTIIDVVDGNKVGHTHCLLSCHKLQVSTHSCASQPLLLFVRNQHGHRHKCCAFADPSASLHTQTVSPATHQLRAHATRHSISRPQALIDGPQDLTGVRRQMIPFKRLALTDFTVKILRNARQGTLKKAFAVSKIL
jgi:ribosomal protein L14E/L6E/L27E